MRTDTLPIADTFRMTSFKMIERAVGWCCERDAKRSLHGLDWISWCSESKNPTCRTSEHKLQRFGKQQELDSKRIRHGDGRRTLRMSNTTEVRN